MGNGYLERRKQELDETAQTVERITRQFDVDTLHITLGRYDKISLGYKRIMEITKLWEQVRKEYRLALTKDPEADVARHHMDQELIQIAKDPEKVIAFEPRYPELQECRYNKRR